jgi:tetratricopeptide (TPR) repeat protein
VFESHRMRPIGLARVLVVTVAIAFAAPPARKPPVVDPNTQEGYFLQLIDSENDVAIKLTLLEKFVIQFKHFSSLDGVYADMQSLYMSVGKFDKAIGAGEKLLEIDRQDIEGAQKTLQAAEATKDPVLIKQWTERIRQIAQALVTLPQPKSHDDSDTWNRRVEIAQQLTHWEEYSLYRKAFDATDPRKKLEYLDAMQRRYPDTQYLKPALLLYFISYQQLGDTRKAFTTGEKILERDQTHEDVLLLVADTLFRQKSDSKRVLNYSNKIIELMSVKPKPAGLTDADWARQKSTLTGLAYSMIGGVYVAQEQYASADRPLRQALALLQGQGHQQQVASTLSYLGWANYKMKNYAEATRFYTMCLGINSPYQESAAKNLTVIKVEQAEQK